MFVKNNIFSEIRVTSFISLYVGLVSVQLLVLISLPCMPWSDPHPLAHITCTLPATQLMQDASVELQAQLGIRCVIIQDLMRDKGLAERGVELGRCG